MDDFVLSRLAASDLTEIWTYVAADNIDAADRLIADLERNFALLAGQPAMGCRREDLTRLDVRFWAVKSYLVIYKETEPLQIVRILSAYRDVVALLES